MKRLDGVKRRNLFSDREVFYGELHFTIIRYDDDSGREHLHFWLPRLMKSATKQIRNTCLSKAKKDAQRKHSCFSTWSFGYSS